ncbi:MAG: hypothetical protein ABI665_03495 [Vicinamibacterales bacterium]
MSTRIRIGIACPITGERAAFIEWLDAAGYEPVPMLDLRSLASTMATRPIEVLLVDIAIVPVAEWPALMRTLGPNRPVILVAESGTAPAAINRDASWLERPVSHESFLMSVALALAEGRPSRRSPRKPVAPLQSSVDGVNSQVLDVSLEGVRLELAGSPSAALPPVFTMRVPAFNVVTSVKRVWVTQPGRGGAWCGGAVMKTSPKAALAWENLVDNAPTSAHSIITEARKFV